MRFAHPKMPLVDGWPTCSRCVRPVERVAVVDSLRGHGEVIVAVHCHGATEKVTLTMRHFLDGRVSIDGPAFVDAKALAPAVYP